MFTSETKTKKVRVAAAKKSTSGEAVVVERAVRDAMKPALDEFKTIIDRIDRRLNELCVEVGQWNKARQ